MSEAVPQLESSPAQEPFKPLPTMANGKVLPPIETRFTIENAKAAAAKSVAVRRERAVERLQRVNPPAVDAPNERLELIREQIARTREVLNAKLEPKERASLLLALDRLLDRERVLLAIPLPGSRRPGRERPSSGQQSTSQGPLD